LENQQKNLSLVASFRKTKSLENNLTLQKLADTLIIPTLFHLTAYDKKCFYPVEAMPYFNPESLFKFGFL